MNLARMGSSFQHRLSFIRQLLRRAKQHQWQFSRASNDWDDDGYGAAVYHVKTQQQTYSLLVFTQFIPDEARTDRVIADMWDACFCLFDGVATDDDIERLRQNVPLQEKGRCSVNELVLSRANKSVRLFEHVVESLSHGTQPDSTMLRKIGYLMRTTAVYGSGKFGCADREKFCDRAALSAPFQVEMLAVYLLRWFVIDWVNHIARKLAEKNNRKSVELHPDYAQYLGIGNATGLGMAPFMVNHPVLIHHWVQARETALARAFAIDRLDKAQQDKFQQLYQQTHLYLQGWQVDDVTQSARITLLLGELKQYDALLPDVLTQSYPLHQLYHYCQQHYSLEMQELMVSLLIEILGAQADDLSEMMSANENISLNPTMRLGEMKSLIEQHYAWALAIDFTAQKNQQTFWYYSEDKMEPRLGKRFTEDGANLEMPLAIARDVVALYQKIIACQKQDDDIMLGELLLEYPEYRAIARRIQLIANHPYGEIYDNLIDDRIRPIDMLRFKLSFFGVSKFDPKSDLWTRVNLFQGAPLPPDNADDDNELWFLPQLSDVPR